MLKNTSRWIGESWCQPVSSGAMPDARVPSAASEADEQDGLMRPRQVPSRMAGTYRDGVRRRGSLDGFRVRVPQPAGHAGEQLARRSRGPRRSAHRTHAGRARRPPSAVCAVTVALRGALSSSASSPNASPGPSVATLRPRRVTLAVPSMITKNSLPVEPSLTRTRPARPSRPRRGGPRGRAPCGRGPRRAAPGRGGRGRNHGATWAGI